MPKLIKQLSAKDSSTRNKAAYALAGYGADAKPATRALIARLKDPNMGVRSTAAYALRSIGTPEATKALDAYEKDRAP
ncbi:MAG: HEAT repeat domain-containing protein [Bdellovibrionales bacterium]|nr:HEAT repeat domain-containing protein [Bdellovibrionales bacterium]